ncbi:DUF3124 domain-containing protein [Labrenzia sp. PHM005]|uniref:DUF3124 domain-containing protein n=1 Tax=Labrenzia sp. PHM005 TaxID=2590016 RepID=UPI00113FC8A5|nr:DUF3124 domain-containing protein [Labrenzia sp. PHM005]QDG78752.1 DUF3124 domain-containing protein [Labrenzia sp. PHM005]
MRFIAKILVLAVLTAVTPSHPVLTAELERAWGELIYVPAYSRIFSFPNRSELLAATLTVHNVDPENSLTLSRIDYHDETGTLLRSFLETPRALKPLESASFLVPSNDTTGGVGANFLVEWTAKTAVLSPLTEAIMVTGPGTPGPSFTSRGRVISRKTEGQ